MSDEQPTQQMPPDPPPQPPRPRLTRSTSDSIVGGVAGGLGRHLGVDPLAIRITFVILSFAGGIGILAYLALWMAVPSDDPNAEPVRWGVARTIGAGLLVVAGIAILSPGWMRGPELLVLLSAGALVYVLIRALRDDGASHIAGIAAKIALGVVLLALAVGGFTAAAAGSALGGGIVIAGLVIGCGIALVGGAFRGGARWLIVPGIVLALPLAAVAATDIDVRGTWGDRTFRPGTVAELGDGYEMGVGSMKIDLRDLELPPGRTELPLQLGLGEIQVLVPDDMCVTTDAAISLGAIDAGGGEEGGVDVDVHDHRTVDPGVRYLHLDVDLGVGEVRVGDRFFQRDRGPGWARDDFDVPNGGTSQAACEATP